VTAIFGENARDEGRFEVAGTVIEFQRQGDQINLVITDTANGQSTTIDVPVPRM
jgi:curli production assembly/transport component CsgF